jgi:hypothetical protein
VKARSRKSRRAENWRKGTIEERASVIAYFPSSPRSAAARRRGAHEGRQAGEVLLGLEDQRVVPLVGEHVLTEPGAECSEPFGDGSETLPCSQIEPRASPYEGCVKPLQDPRLLGHEVEAFASREQVVDAAEQGRVQEDRAAMPSEHRRDLALYRLECVAGVRAGEPEEHRRHPGEAPPGPLEGVDGVGERRCGRGVGDGRNLGAMLCQRLLEGWPEVVGRYSVERR